MQQCATFSWPAETLIHSDQGRLFGEEPDRLGTDHFPRQMAKCADRAASGPFVRGSRTLLFGDVPDQGITSNASMSTQVFEDSGRFVPVTSMVRVCVPRASPVAAKLSACSTSLGEY
jgi:hypothetical protein